MSNNLTKELISNFSTSAVSISENARSVLFVLFDRINKSMVLLCE